MLVFILLFHFILFFYVLRLLVGWNSVAILWHMSVCRAHWSGFNHSEPAWYYLSVVVFCRYCVQHHSNRNRTSLFIKNFNANAKRLEPYYFIVDLCTQGHFKIVFYCSSSRRNEHIKEEATRKRINLHGNVILSIFFSLLFCHEHCYGRARIFTPAERWRVSVEHTVRIRYDAMRWEGMAMRHQHKSSFLSLLCPRMGHGITNLVLTFH